MKILKKLKDYKKVLALFGWGFVTVATSAAALNTMEGFYIVCGILNLGINAFCIYSIAKYNEED